MSIISKGFNQLFIQLLANINVMRLRAASAQREPPSELEAALLAITVVFLAVVVATILGKLRGVLQLFDWHKSTVVQPSLLVHTV